MHVDLLTALKLAYEPSGYVIRNYKPEVESKEYGAADFEMNEKHIKFRVAKITPIKIGQFVTLWKRCGKEILPYDLADPVDLFVVSVQNFSHIGQFVFPKTVLSEMGVVSKSGKGGKRAMRVYPPWDVTDNLQAKKTQAWQLPYYFDLRESSVPNIQHLFTF